MPTATFYQRTAPHRQGVQPHTLQPKWSCTVRFQRNIPPRAHRQWNELTAGVLQDGTEQVFLLILTF